MNTLAHGVDYEIPPKKSFLVLRSERMDFRG